MDVKTATILFNRRLTCGTKFPSTRTLQQPSLNKQHKHRHERMYFDLPSESDHCQFCRSGRTDRSSQCGTHTHIFCKCWLHKRCSKMIHFHFLLQVLTFFWRLLNSLDWDKASSCSFYQQACDPKHSFASWPWFLSWAAWNPQHTALYHNSKTFLISDIIFPQISAHLCSTYKRPRRWLNGHVETSRTVEMATSMKSHSLIRLWRSEANRTKLNVFKHSWVHALCKVI